MDLNTPKFTQPDVLRVTRVKPAVLQTWTNRKAIELAVQNPGTGKPRLYTALDIVKVAIMRRLSDLRVDLSVAKQIAEATAAIMSGSGFDISANGGPLAWDSYLFMRPDDATQKAFHLNRKIRSPLEALDNFGLKENLDPHGWRLTQIAWPWGGTGMRRSSGLLDEPHGPIDDRMRQHWASQGFHAEPVIIFPLGEIVRGTLLQVQSLLSNTKSDQE